MANAPESRKIVIGRPQYAPMPRLPQARRDQGIAIDTTFRAGERNGDILSQPLVSGPESTLTLSSNVGNRSKSQVGAGIRSAWQRGS
jgi:hypothetical protein